MELQCIAAVGNDGRDGEREEHYYPDGYYGSRHGGSSLGGHAAGRGRGLSAQNIRIGAWSKCRSTSPAGQLTALSFALNFLNKLNGQNSK